MISSPPPQGSSDPGYDPSEVAVQEAISPAGVGFDRTRGPMQASPNSEESEMAVLAGFMLDNSFLDEYPVDPRLFYFERNRILYEAMAAVRLDGPVDLRTMQAYLEQNGLFAKAGGISYMANLDLALPDLGRIGAYVKVLEDRAFRRDFLEATDRLSRAALDGAKDQGALLSALQAALAKLQSGAAVSTDDFKPFGPAVMALVDELEATPVGHAPGLTTGFSTIDDLTNGMMPGKFWGIAGRPGSGKTSLGMNFALAQAESGIPVAVISLEMSLRGVVVRALSSGSGVRSRKFLRGQVDAVERFSMRQFATQSAHLPLYISERAALRIEKICELARALVAEGKCRVLYIDHLRHILCEPGRSRTEEIATITRALVGLAKELGITIVLLIQLNRDIEKRGTDAIPQPSDLEASGAIEQDLDVLAFVHRDQAKDVAGQPSGSQFRVAKNRDGDTGRPQRPPGFPEDGPDLIFDRATTTFYLPAADYSGAPSAGGDE